MISKIFYNINDIPKLLAKGELNPANIALTGSARNFWLNILREAELQKKIQDFVKKILDEYPNNDDLKEAYRLAQELDLTPTIKLNQQKKCQILVVYEGERDKQHWIEINKQLIPFSMTYDFEIKTIYDIDFAQNTKEKQIEMLNEYEIWLLMISPDFFTNNYFRDLVSCFQKKIIIPILIRSVYIKELEAIGGIVTLPRNGLFLSDFEESRKDNFYYVVGQGIKELLDKSRCNK